MEPVRSFGSTSYEVLLRVDHGVREVVRRRKPNVSAPVPAGVLAELVACDAVVSAVGD